MKAPKVEAVRTRKRSASPKNTYELFENVVSEIEGLRDDINNVATEMESFSEDYITRWKDLHATTKVQLDELYAGRERFVRYVLASVILLGLTATFAFLALQGIQTPFTGGGATLAGLATFITVLYSVGRAGNGK